jgi:serine/threonine-protein kinase
VADDALVGAVLDGRYRIIGPIAKGAMGTVYTAERLKLGRAVAIKVMHERLPNEMSGRKRFEVEAKAMAQLEHPHCVTVIDIGIHENKPYIVMELVRGKDLKTLLADGPFTQGRAVAIVKQILSGLGHAHELGIIHRDIKPPNIVVSNKSGIGEHVRILDFGLAYSDAHSTGHITDGFAVGTPAYMSPEQCSGQPVSLRTDLYAVGVVLFELLVGRRPFEHDDPLEIVRMHLQDPPPRLDAFGAAPFGVLEDIVARALAKDPADRYEDAPAMARALDAVHRPSSELAVDKSIPLDVDDLVDLHSSTLMGFEPPASNRTPLIGVAAIATPPAGVAAVVERHATAPSAPQPRFLSQPPVIVPDPPAVELPPSPDEPSVVEPASVAIPAPRSGNRLFAILLVLGFAAAGVGVAFAMGWVSIADDAPPEAPPNAPDQDRAYADRAAELAAGGRIDLALEQVTAGRLAVPTSALLAYRAGRYQTQRGAWRDALAAFRDAIRLDVRYRQDADLIRDVLRGFILASDFEPQATFLHDEIGAAAEPYLNETSRTHPAAKIRARATAELQRYR